jgi:hypothetical protein
VWPPRLGKIAKRIIQYGRRKCKEKDLEKECGGNSSKVLDVRQGLRKEKK